MRGCAHIKMDFFCRYREINLSVFGNQNNFQILQKLGFTDIGNLFTDIGTYFPISAIISLNREILDTRPLASFTNMV